MLYTTKIKDADMTFKVKTRNNYSN